MYKRVLCLLDERACKFAMTDTELPSTSSALEQRTHVLRSQNVRTLKKNIFRILLYIFNKSTCSDAHYHRSIIHFRKGDLVFDISKLRRTCCLPIRTYNQERWVKMTSRWRLPQESGAES
jgi:hypothetical protein